MNDRKSTARPPSQPSAYDLRNLPADGGENYNRLVFEKSPYLLQHAANPVDWYPWGEEAFSRAREEDRPIFLSIGYSTCHWCHVMAHESFADAEVATLLNRHFIAVKVDREERPDIDATFMAACQLMTGSGGWPLTIVLTPERQPFFAGTYFPPRSRQGALGLMPLLEKIVELWQGQRSRVEETGRQLAATLQQRNSRSSAAGNLSEQPLRQALEQYRRNFDPAYGGFGGAPKFPAPHNLSLLLRLGRRLKAPEATAMALRTLEALRLGGIYDQVGFGLHRYAVDAKWLVPHFEKMLYDQALLILAAVEAWQVSGDPYFAQLAEETAHYLLRDLRHEEGGFFCGEDADSEGAEGTFYLWSPEQVADALDPALAHLFCRCFDITAAGNFEGRSIPHLGQDLAALAAELNLDSTVLAERLRAAREGLLARRSRRPRPHRDEKVLTAWNGLAIAALARAGAALGREELVAAAAGAAAFVGEKLRSRQGRLLRRWCDGEAAIPGFLDDYAFFCWGLLELHQARLESAYLELALELTEEMEGLFGDGQGGLYDSGSDAEEVLGRGRSLQDGAIPSGTSVAIGNLLRLGRLTGDAALEERGRQLLARALAEIERYPSVYAQALCALDFALGPEEELTLLPDADGQGMEPLLAAVRNGFFPGLLLKMAPAAEVAAGAPAGAQLCRDRTCLPPVQDAAALLGLLQPKESRP